MKRLRRKPKINIPAKYILLGITIVCFICMFGSFVFQWNLGPVRSVAGKVFIPMQKGLNHVGEQISEVTGELASLGEIRAENEILKKQVEELSSELSALQMEQYDTDELRELLDLDKTYSDYEKIAANVIGKDPGNWFDTFIIDKGTDDGIAVNMNVISGNGLVGIVTEVGSNYARVKSIIDDTANISCMVLSTSENCVVTGNLQTMDDKQVIEFSNLKDSDDEVSVGDQVVTSYISPNYVQGLLVGHISEIRDNANKLTKSGTITPVVDFEHVKHVFVITELKQTVEEE